MNEVGRRRNGNLLFWLTRRLGRCELAFGRRRQFRWRFFSRKLLLVIVERQRAGLSAAKYFAAAVRQYSWLIIFSYLKKNRLPIRMRLKERLIYPASESFTVTSCSADWFVVSTSNAILFGEGWGSDWSTRITVAWDDTEEMDDNDVEDIDEMISCNVASSLIVVLFALHKYITT